MGYVDDVIIGGTTASVNHDVGLIKQSGAELCLHLDVSKCELICNALPFDAPNLNGFIQIKPCNACLLGAPLFVGSTLDNALKKRLVEVTHLSENIRSISSHDALLNTEILVEHTQDHAHAAELTMFWQSSID